MSDLVEYPQGGEFPGVVGRTVQESSPAWPAPARAKDGAPNVLYVVLDDVEIPAGGAEGVSWPRAATPAATPST